MNMDLTILLGNISKIVTAIKANKDSLSIVERECLRGIIVAYLDEFDQ